MADGAGATVVVTARDRWSEAPAALDRLIASTGPDAQIVVVDGAAPRSIGAKFDRLADQGAIRVVRQERFLAANEAKNLGAEGVKSEWIAFIENDVFLSDGWLDRLIRVAEERDATAVYPAYLHEDHDGRWVVHGLGCDLEFTGPEGRQWVKERQHHLFEPWGEVRASVGVIERPQAEPHAVVVRRSLVEGIGGFDEQLLSWFEHTDLALHIRKRGGSSWLVPDVTCLYRPPPPLAFSDYRSFGLRWSADWLTMSLVRLCEVWGLDVEDPGWGKHDRYRKLMRRRILTKWPKVNYQIDRVVGPFQSWDARRWLGQRADAG